MIGNKLLGLLLCALLAKHSRSIELILPLSEEDAPNFFILKKSSLPPSSPTQFYSITCYTGLRNDLIRRIVYFGEELLNDQSPHDSSFRRFVLLLVSNEKVVLATSKKESGTFIAETVFEITNGIVRAITEFPDELDGPGVNQQDLLLRTILSSIFGREPDSKKNDYGDLDTVDDTPYLVRGRDDVSPEEIQRQVQEILQENSEPIDLSIPRPSGLLRGKKRKLEEEED